MPPWGNKQAVTKQMREASAEIFKRESGPLLRVALLLALPLLVSGCGLINRTTPPVITNIITAEPGSPFLLEVDRVVNTAGQVHVFGHVLSQAKWPASELMVRLSGYRLGERVRETAKPINEAAPPGSKKEPDDLEPGKTKPFYIALPAEGLSDIEVGLFWGEEARSVIPSGKTELALPVQLASLEMTQIPAECAGEKCPAKFVVTFQLSNIGKTIVDGVVLGVSYAKSADESISGENEERVPITGLGLKPDEKRKVKLNFQSPLPPELAARVKPTVRVLEVN